MIPLSKINRITNAFNVLSETIEKDYIITWILCCLSKSKTLQEDFVFCGGTVIKHMYFEDHRFSEDIDLISKKEYQVPTLLKSYVSV